MPAALRAALAAEPSSVEHYMLGKGQNALDVLLVHAVLVELDIGDDLVLPDPVHLPAVGVRVENLLADKRLDQALLALFDPGFSLLPELLEFVDLALPLLPDLQNRLSQGLEVFGLGLESVQ